MSWGDERQEKRDRDEPTGGGGPGNRSRPRSGEEAKVLPQERGGKLDSDSEGDDTGEDNECIAFDTIETYTANVQNKKRIFADEILRV